MAAFAIAITSVATILGAYFFQYVIGLAPCPLCLEQRIPYYIAGPLAVVLAIAAARGAPSSLIRGGLATLAIIMFAGWRSALITLASSGNFGRARPSARARSRFRFGR